MMLTAAPQLGQASMTMMMIESCCSISHLGVATLLFIQVLVELAVVADVLFVVGGLHLQPHILLHTRLQL